MSKEQKVQKLFRSGKISLFIFMGFRFQMLDLYEYLRNEEGDIYTTVRQGKGTERKGM